MTFTAFLCHDKTPGSFLPNPIPTLKTLILLISDLGYIFVFLFRASFSSHNTIPCLKGSAAVWKPEGWAGLSPCIAGPHSKGAGGEAAAQQQGREWPQRCCCIGSSNTSCCGGCWFGSEGEERRTVRIFPALHHAMGWSEGTERTCTASNLVLSPNTSPWPLVRWEVQSPGAAARISLEIFRTGRVFQALKVSSSLPQ